MGSYAFLSLGFVISELLKPRLRAIEEKKERKEEKRKKKNMEIEVPTRSRYRMVSVKEAEDAVCAHAKSLGKVAVHELAAEDLLGSIVAEDVIAKEPVPSFRASMMDGYAMLAEDGAGAAYAVSGHITAGSGGGGGGGERKKVLTSGFIRYITTGAPVPPGADAVVKVEDTELQQDGKVLIKGTVNRGQWIREVGSDVSPGTVVLPAVKNWPCRDWAPCDDRCADCFPGRTSSVCSSQAACGDPVDG